MRREKLNPFKIQNSKFKINLRALLVLVICLTGLSVIYQRPLVQIALLAITILLIFSQHPDKKSIKSLWIRISRIGRLILIIFIFQLLFRRNGEIIWQLGFIQITDIGLNYALASSLRFFLIILVAGLLMEVPFQEYLHALRAWKFPYEISFLVATTIHFLPVFQKIFKNKLETIKLRNIDLKKLRLSERFHLFRILLIPVLAAAIHDIRYRAISLELRAFRLYPTRTSLHQSRLQKIDHFIIYSTLILTTLTIIILSF
ncbi:MAG: energy-coupling factor transporter transmembrane protein EcfT [Candidatus Cloacimonetes bacterium]|nr:energy-coupling factor transporter transmembrane protein EcfT [Candidatus Cloacimonadota bacterium]